MGHIINRIKRSQLRRLFSSTINDSLLSNPILDLLRIPHTANNVSENVKQKIGKNLHLKKDHPLYLTKIQIENFCKDYAIKNGQIPFQVFDNLDPIVSTKACFDDLRVPPSHVSRRPSDTYYVTDDQVLRTHTSAHQCELMRKGEKAFLCAGDVYRRDEIDSTHYPVFHQIEGVRLFDVKSLGVSSEEAAKLMVEKDLKELLTALAKHLFGSDTPIRWREDYFPFTEPSFELDVHYQNDWMELLGCGLIHPDVLQNAGIAPGTGCIGWAFGLGLERLAMTLFGIPDIRLFWTSDERFTQQFSMEKLSATGSIKFQSFSKYPDCYKDVSFWLPSSSGESVKSSESTPTSTNKQRAFHSNDVYEIIRGIAGDIVESVKIFDTFTHPKTGRTSHAYRITYRHMERSLTNQEVDEVQNAVRRALVDQLGVVLR